MFTTSEEHGLLGAKYYPRALTQEQRGDISGVLNFDVLNIFGKTKDVSFYESSAPLLDNIADVCAKKQGRIISADPKPKTGMFYRSNHWQFARIGIPTLFINMGLQSVDPNEDIQILDSRSIS